ncbi:MAG: MATE family efflux transporter, partial [Butyricicoccus sp.]
RIYFTGFLFAGVNMVTAAFFSASDKTVQGFVLSLLRGVIAVPPILFPLAWALGVDGVWLTFPMVELVTTVAALVWARKYIIEN